MKLQSPEVQRLITNAILVKKVSPATNSLILKNELSEFAKNAFDRLQRKKSLKSLVLVCVEIEKEEG